MMRLQQCHTMRNVKCSIKIQWLLLNTFSFALKDYLRSHSEYKYYAIRIEFQFQGSPHAHCFIWVKNFPLLTEETTDSFVEFIDQHVQAYLPDPISEPELHQLFKMYQTHAHS